MYASFVSLVQGKSTLADFRNNSCLCTLVPHQLGKGASDVGSPHRTRIRDDDTRMLLTCLHSCTVYSSNNTFQLHSKRKFMIAIFNTTKRIIFLYSGMSDLTEIG